jgi:hypothetical protein
LSILISSCAARDMVSLARIILIATSARAPPSRGSARSRSRARSTVENTPLPLQANSS